jgi:hypothetical protein
MSTRSMAYNSTRVSSAKITDDDKKKKTDKSKKKKNVEGKRAEVNIDSFGGVSQDGNKIYLKTPLVRVPFGVENYKGAYVVTFEMIRDPSSDPATYNFLHWVAGYDASIAEQIEGDYTPSVKAGSGKWGSKIRTKMIVAKGAILTTLRRDGQSMSPLELDKGDTGIFTLKLHKAWTLNGKAGSVWLIDSGDLTHSENAPTAENEPKKKGDILLRKKKTKKETSSDSD